VHLEHRRYNTEDAAQAARQATAGSVSIAYRALDYSGLTKFAPQWWRNFRAR